MFLEEGLSPLGMNTLPLQKDLSGILNRREVAVSQMVESGLPMQEGQGDWGEPFSEAEAWREGCHMAQPGIALRKPG